VQIYDSPPSGDQINLTMATAAFNFRKWMRMLIFWLKTTLQFMQEFVTNQNPAWKHAWI